MTEPTPVLPLEDTPDEPVNPSPVDASPSAGDTSPADVSPPEVSPAGAEAPNATPAAQAHAEATGVDLTQVEGTGKDGTITKADVAAAAPAEGGGEEAAPPSQQTDAAAPAEGAASTEPGAAPSQPAFLVIYGCLTCPVELAVKTRVATDADAAANGAWIPDADLPQHGGPDVRQLASRTVCPYCGDTLSFKRTEGGPRP